MQNILGNSMLITRAGLCGHAPAASGVVACQVKNNIAPLLHKLSEYSESDTVCVSVNMMRVSLLNCKHA